MIGPDDEGGVASTVAGNGDYYPITDLVEGVNRTDRLCAHSRGDQEQGRPDGGREHSTRVTSHHASGQSRAASSSPKNLATAFACRPTARVALPPEPRRSRNQRAWVDVAFKDFAQETR